jgi:hypothetical protein
MPLPLVLLAVGVAAAGIKKGYQAHKKNSEAKELISQAHGIFNQAQEELNETRKETEKVFVNLGQLRLNVWGRQLGRFVELFSQLRNVELTGEAVACELGPMPITPNELAQMRDLSLRAIERTRGGVMATGAGALAGMAAYGGTMMLASASTGTAITALSGVAATNATLAWLGGGSLATGGMGMAGGMVVLGGICLAPALLLGSILYGSKARGNFAKAQGTMAQARRDVEEMHLAKSVLHGIKKVASEFCSLIHGLESHMTLALDKLEYGIGFGTNYSQYKEPQRLLVHLSVEFAQVMKLLLETPLLEPDGAPRQDYHSAFEQGHKLLESSQKEATKGT